MVDNILTAAVSFYIYNSFRFSLCCFKLVTHIHWPCFCRRLSECKVFKNLRWVQYHLLNYYFKRSLQAFGPARLSRVCSWECSKPIWNPKLYFKNAL